MSKALDTIASIPFGDWIDLGYALILPSATVTVLPLLILWCRP